MTILFRASLTSMDYRIVVLGACNSGKTALTRVFVQNMYPEYYVPTIEDNYRKQVTVDGESCLLNIVDTSEFHSVLTEEEVRSGDAFICAYAVDDLHSYELIETYLVKIQLIKPHAPVVLVSTKCDLLSENWKVSISMGHYLSARYRIPLVETSGVGIEDSFILVISQLRHLKDIETNQTPHKNCCSIC